MKWQFGIFLGLALSTTAVAAFKINYIAEAIGSADRPIADVKRDDDRKPATLMAFAGIKPGQTVADIMPGGGYFTRIFSKIAGPRGGVYAIVPAELLQVAPKSADAVNTIAASPGFGNVKPIVEPTAQIAAPHAVDVAWTSDNYHDLYGFFGADRAEQFDNAVFRMLRPGGVFIVIDHVAAVGADASTTKKLHRIDPQVVKAQAMAAGFKLDGESDALRNTADTHALPVFDPSIRGRTDQFILKFRKPAR